MPRTFRERPRYALLLGVGLVCLVGLGVLAWVVIAGGDDSSQEEAAAAARARQAQALRATRLNLEEARDDLAASREELERLDEAGARQRARTAAWRRRALQLERRNQALREALAEAGQEEPRHTPRVLRRPAPGMNDLVSVTRDHKGEGGVALLAIDQLIVRFGGVTALAGPSFGVDQGPICGLIGPNGAGKTTIFNCISRLYTPQPGGSSSTATTCCAREPHEIASLGIARTFQNLGLSRSLTVRENVMLGAHHRARPSFVDRRAAPAGRPPRGARAQPRGRRDPRAARPGRRRRPPAGGPAVSARSSGSSWRARLCGGRACCMLDEPASGLSHEEVDQLADLLLEPALGLRPDRAAGRAPHGDGHADLRPRRRARTSAK